MSLSLNLIQQNNYIGAYNRPIGNTGFPGMQMGGAFSSFLNPSMPLLSAPSFGASPSMGLGPIFGNFLGHSGCPPQGPNVNINLNAHPSQQPCGGPRGGNGNKGHLDGYIRGLMDSLKQIKGPKSEKAGDNKRVKSLLDRALRKREKMGLGGHGTPGGCGPRRGPAPAGRGMHLSVTGVMTPFGRMRMNDGGSCQGQGHAAPRRSDRGGGGGYSAGYRQGIQEALGSVSKKASGPDRQRIQSLLGKDQGCGQNRHR